MNDRDQLMASIKADPLDDTVRLAYADYLDEQGTASDSAHARVIRAQIELSKIGPEPILISSMLRSHGPDYWSVMLSDWDADVKRDDRVDVEEEVRMSKKPSRKFHRLRVMKVEVDDPSLRTRIAYLKRDEYSTPWPKDYVRKLQKEVYSLCTPEILIPSDGEPLNTDRFLFDEGSLWITPDAISRVMDRGFISKLITSVPTPALAPLIDRYPITDVEFTSTPILVNDEGLSHRLQKHVIYISSLGPDHSISLGSYRDAMGWADATERMYGDHYLICRNILKAAFPTVPRWIMRNE